jgi:hypothetical protein
MKSAWEFTKERSKYHFDNTRMDPAFDAVTYLGNIKHDWSSEIAEIIDTSREATWRTRGKDFISGRPEEELASEDYDLDQAGYGADYVISNLSYEMTPTMKKIEELFCLEDNIPRVHVQLPGQMWNLHIDKLQKWCPEDPNKIVRIFVQLTDWQQGQFWHFGNYMWSGWKAGDVVTFDWQNVPHSTANASYDPRITLQLTGLKTDNTLRFFDQLKSGPVTV